MPVHKHEYPILEYDTAKDGVIRPGRHKVERLPSKCLMTFFGEVLRDYASRNNPEEIEFYNSEMGHFPTYKAQYKNTDICIIQAVVGSASAAMMADKLIGHGVRELIACGGCAVMADIPAGDVIIPVAALRDEGASYHYLPPAREIALDADVTDTLKATLEDFHTPYIEAKTWTTDAFYRETPDMITYRVQEGCRVVEMECATLAAVARFRGARFGQLLYSGDILTDYENYDERDWMKLPARGKLFMLALEALVRL